MLFSCLCIGSDHDMSYSLLVKGNYSPNRTGNIYGMKCTFLLSSDGGWCTVWVQDLFQWCSSLFEFKLVAWWCIHWSILQIGVWLYWYFLWLGALTGFDHLELFFCLWIICFRFPVKVDWVQRLFKLNNFLFVKKNSLKKWTGTWILLMTFIVVIRNTNWASWLCFFQNDKRK